METRSGAFLASIEAAFAFLIERFAFEVAQSTDAPAFAWFRAGDRTVVVSYDPFDDAAVDVHLEVKSTEERYLFSDLLAFEAFDASRHANVREREAVEAEIARAATLVSEHAQDFLRGDLDAFRRRFREALLVQSTRQAAMHEFYEGDPRRSKALFGALRAYWTDADREHYQKLESGGDDTLAHLRLKKR